MRLCLGCSTGKDWNDDSSMILIDGKKDANDMNVFPTGFFERLLTFCKGKSNLRVGALVEMVDFGENNFYQMS